MYVLDLDPTEKRHKTKSKDEKGRSQVFTELLAVMFSSLTQCGERIERSMC